MQGNQKQALWGYIAGIMDADGCFMIIKQKRGTIGIKPTWDLSGAVYTGAMKIAQVEEEAIKFITHKVKFGWYNLEGARKSRPNSKPLYHWYLREKNSAMKFLKNVIPYLRIKKKRAKFLLRFIQHMDKFLKKNFNKKITVSELNFRERMYLKMRKLNEGNAATTTKPSRRVSVNDSLNKHESA